MDSMTDSDVLSNNPWLTVNHAPLTGARHTPTLYMVTVSIQPKHRIIITWKKHVHVMSQLNIYVAPISIQLKLTRKKNSMCKTFTTNFFKTIKGVQFDKIASEPLNCNQSQNKTRGLIRRLTFRPPCRFPPWKCHPQRTDQSRWWRKGWSWR